MSDCRYLCPGESHPISRPVHLARLAAGFPACARCLHRDDVGVLPVRVQPQRPSLAAPSIYQTDRLWSVERSATTRTSLLEAAAAVASLLWSDSPPALPATDWDARDMTLAAAPTVCLAHDGSPLAMRVAADISRQLVPMRCRLVSLGHGSRPSLDFAVDHLSASAGLYVESGESPAGVGFSVVGRGGIPWSLGGRLDRVRGLQDQGIRRTSRTGGVVTAFDATAPYRAGLIRSFQDLRGLEIAVGGLSEFALRCWSDLSEQVSCRLHPIPASPRIENGEPSRASLRPLMDAIVEHRWDGGLVFDADGRRLWAIDRRDGLVSQRDVCGWIARDLAGERNLRGLKTVAYESTMWLDLSVAHAAVSFAPDSNESLVREMLESNAPLAADGQGRFWIADPTPRCDALVTAASVLRHWSRQRLRTAA